MVDILERGSNWLEDQRVAHASRPVIYHRGESNVEVPASIGRTVFEIDDGLGILERTESRDFLVPAASLVLNDTQALPERGDRIRETIGSVTFTYEVMAPGKEPPWRYSDAYRRTLRIHTKLTGTETT